ncbi:unnamed protein product [Coregonus sp. 'balchen']|nr:unnamed protein product [Coregonus sp. 'balchen']
MWMAPQEPLRTEVETPNGNLLDVTRAGANNNPRQALQVREKLTTYFSSPAALKKIPDHLSFMEVLLSCPLQVSDDDSPEPGLGLGAEMETFQVRRLSCRNLQLPPLAFRQAEQRDWAPRPETEQIPRPTSLALRIPPLIAITSADTSRLRRGQKEAD